MPNHTFRLLPLFAGELHVLLMLFVYNKQIASIEACKCIE